MGKNAKVDIILLWGDKGGVENVVNETACYLQSKNWDVRLVQFAWQGIRWCSKDLPFFVLSEGEHGHDTAELAEKLASFWKKSGIPDIIISAGAPIQLYIIRHAMSLLQLNSTTTKIPLLSWTHGDPSDYARRSLGGLRELALADIHLAISDKIKNYLVQNLLSPTVYRVYNPIRKDAFSDDIIPAPDGNEYRLLYIGRLSPDKHLDTILNAMANKDCQMWFLDIYGSGDADSESSITSQIRDLGLSDKVKIHGWTGNPWSEISFANGLVLASEFEASPLVVPEALSHGIPVIATPVGDVPEIITPGQNGYLFPIFDSESLSKILGFWAAGYLPQIDPVHCKESVKNHEHDNALASFEHCLSLTLYGDLTE